MRAFNSYRRCVFTAAAAKTPKALFQTQTRSCSFSSVHWAQPPMSVLKNCAGVSLLCPQQLIGGGSGSGMAKTKADLEMAALGELVAAACSGGGGSCLLVMPVLVSEVFGTEEIFVSQTAIVC
eukprot:PhM_4_TR15322/c0_g1_i1/m.81026